MTIITAKLSPWRLSGTGIEGIIRDSISKDYEDGERYLFLNTSLTLYQYAQGFWDDHFIMKTQTGLYFMLASKDEKVRWNDTPMA